MAKLIAPKSGYRTLDSKGKPKGKVHLAHPRDDGKILMTMCKIVIWEPAQQAVLIKDVAPEDVCLRCAGAMVVV